MPNKESLYYKDWFIKGNGKVYNEQRKIGDTGPIGSKGKIEPSP